MLRYFIAAVFIVLAGYGCIKAWPLLVGPSLSVVSPANAASYAADGIAAVQGNAKRAAELTLNGAPLLRDQNGDFSSALTFPRGGSILTFVATDRFGRAVTVTRSIFVK